MSTGLGWLLFFHILAAFWLAAGAFSGSVVRAAAKRAPGLPERVAYLRLTKRIVMVLIIPGSVTVALTGVALVPVAQLSFRIGWIHVSLALWAVAFAIGVFYSRPYLLRLLAAAEASLAAGAPTDELRALVAARLPKILVDIPSLLLLVILFLMVFKPF